MNTKPAAAPLSAAFWAFARDLPAQLAARPRTVFWSFAALHLIVWTVVPVLVQPNWPWDVVEQIAWGKEWQLVFFKHPPLPAWVIELGVRASGNAYWMPYLISQVWVVIAFWAVWRLAGMMLDETRALLAVLMLEGVTYYNLFTPEFNHNVAQLPFWALIGWLLYRSILGDRLIDWALLGLFTALALLSKYAAGLLLLPLAVFFLLEPRARTRLSGLGPWLAVAVALAALAPNLYSLYRIDFLPFNFPFQRARAASAALEHVVYPLLFAGGQLLDSAGAFALMSCLTWGALSWGPFRWGPPAAPSNQVIPATPDWFARRYVLVLALGPLALAGALSAVLGLELSTHWGQPMCGFLPLLMLLFLPTHITPDAIARFAALWLVVFVGFAAINVAHYRITPHFSGDPTRSNFPGRLVAEDVERQWAAATNGRPLRYVAGNMWIAGTVAANLAGRPSVLWDDLVKSPYIDLAALRRDGAVILWQADRWTDSSTAKLLAMFPDARTQPPIVRPYLTSAAIPPAVVEWAIVPPADDSLR